MSEDKSPKLPSLRWGIIGTGLISSWFVDDLLLPRPSARAQHIIQAIGASSLSKAQQFASTHVPDSSPSVYGSYDAVYADPHVTIVYIGTPHVFHKAACLAAIAAGKHVLCEKPFTVNAKDAADVFAVAKAKGVFIMEAMWTRFFPIVHSLRQKLYGEKVIGDVRRTFCDFGLDMDVTALGADSRLRSRELGAGALLDIGIYSLTWGLLTLEDPAEEQQETPKVVAVQSLYSGIDISSTLVLQYAVSGRQGIVTSTTEHKSDAGFCRVEGTHGHIVVYGGGASVPASFVIHRKAPKAVGDHHVQQPKPEPEECKFEFEGRGFFYEADAVALDIEAGRMENELVSHKETLRVLGIMDEARRQGGVTYPQDE